MLQQLHETELTADLRRSVTASNGEQRAHWLDKITDLLVWTAPQLSDRQLAIFDDVIENLAGDISYRARLDLSRKIATLERAPLRILDKLARDGEFEVAAPVLEFSRGVHDRTLVHVVEKGDEERRVVVARRAVVSEAVSDALVTHGRDRSVTVLARNAGAKISPRGFELLARRVTEDETLSEAVLARADLPDHLVKQMIEVASERAKKMLHDTGHVGAEAALAVAARGREILETRNSAALIVSFEETMAEVDAIVAARPIGDKDVMAWLSSGQTGHAVCAMSRLASLPVEVVQKALHAQFQDELLFIVKAIPLSWRTYRLLLSVKLGHEPDGDTLTASVESFSRLSVDTARRVTSFMRTRSRPGIVKN